MNTNRIPESYVPLINLAYDAGTGASTIGPEVGLVHHPAAAITADREQLEATQAAYFEARTQHAAARLALRAPTAEARDFCASAVDVLKTPFGRRWNARWLAVGFLEGSIALPADPLMLLLNLAAYLGEHPEHENAPLNITAARADALREDLLSAGTTVVNLRAAEADAKHARDAAFKALRQRLSGLRVELSLLLPPNDARWQRFGFRQPAHVRMPAPVSEVSVRTTSQSEAVLSWAPSRRAKNYRVTWQVADGSAEPVVAGLFTDPAAVIPRLPPGKEIVIRITARNRSGESSPVAVHVQLEAADATAPLLAQT